MVNINQYKNSDDPLLRAACWLADFSWRNPEDFEMLQELSKECEKASQIIAKQILDDRKTSGNLS